MSLMIEENSVYEMFLDPRLVLHSSSVYVGVPIHGCQNFYT